MAENSSRNFVLQHNRVLSQCKHALWHWAMHLSVSLDSCLEAFGRHSMNMGHWYEVVWLFYRNSYLVFDIYMKGSVGQV